MLANESCNDGSGAGRKPASLAGPPYRVASRLNSFRPAEIGIAAAVRRMAAVPGLTAIELNYPQHVVDLGETQLRELLAETELPLTALNLRFDDRRFDGGAFTAPDPRSRDAAIDLARRAIDLAAQLGAEHVVLWLANDGWDYPIEVDYARLWHDEIEGFRLVAQADPAILTSVEYKPFDPRPYSLIASMGDALLAARDVGLPNFGVTLDVCHSYMAGEHPPAAAARALAEHRLFGIHLNDGRGRADDGLVFGSIHERDAIELLAVLVAGSYAGTLYFDTFPERADPAAELAANIARLDHLWSLAVRLDGERLAAIRQRHDGLGAVMESDGQ
jgi:xylose isomerase